MSVPVICDNAAKTPAPLEILPHCDFTVLATRFLALRFLRFTVLVFARLRLANEYYIINLYLYVEKKKWF